MRITTEKRKKKERERGVKKFISHPPARGARTGFSPTCVPRTGRFLVSESGFTLVEILVVISITVLLSSFLIISAGRGRQQTETYAEGAQILQALFRAKNSSMAMLTAANDIPCGYGAQMNYSAQTYSVFKYDPPVGSPCQPSIESDVIMNSITTGQTFKVNSESVISAGSSGDGVQMMLFIPPDPQVFIWYQGGGSNPSKSMGRIYLSSQDGKTKLAISVNGFGEITMDNLGTP